jgi:hypothetical protein
VRVSRNGRNQPRRPRIELPSAATPEEAAAIAAAIEGFLRDTAPPPAAPAGPRMSPWARAGVFEGAGLDPAGPGPWGDPHPWGR